jgi:N-acetylglutamate synthase-like GNAT family acetyltransferase
VALSAEIQKLVDNANLSSKQRRQTHEDKAFNYYGAARDWFARLGFEKATKDELEQILLDKLVTERDERLCSASLCCLS